MTANTSRAASTSRRNGLSAERQVLAAVERYSALGIAWLKRVETATAFSRGGALRPTQGAGVDFIGLLAGGRCCAVEVKSTASVSLPLEVHGTASLRPRQRVELSWVDALGGLALVLVRTRAGWWRLTWEGWDAALALADAAARASLSPAIMDECGRRLECAVTAPLFLEGLR
jgi:hypothetical protein